MVYLFRSIIPLEGWSQCGLPSLSCKSPLSIFVFANVAVVCFSGAVRKVFWQPTQLRTFISWVSRWSVLITAARLPSFSLDPCLYLLMCFQILCTMIWRLTYKSREFVVQRYVLKEISLFFSLSFVSIYIGNEFAIRGDWGTMSPGYDQTVALPKNLRRGMNQKSLSTIS